ncbi:hypothetical protein LIA77_07068 [Sarocladium implicatum]|nr:hypothetical protein LIA77_07068 [Sarocladium implicatum]
MSQSSVDVNQPIEMPTSWTIDPDWPTTSVAAVWLWDKDHPDYIEASVAPITGRSITFAVECPSKLCATTSFVPQTVTFDQYNGVWAGERTSKGTTTYWVCDDGDLHPDEASMGDIRESMRGICAHTTGANVKRPRLADATKQLDDCFFAQRRVPAVITEGVEELYSLVPYRKDSPNVSQYVSFIKEYAEEACGAESEAESSGPATAAAETTTSTAEETEETGETSTRSDAETGGTTTEDTAESTPTDGGASRSSLSAALVVLLAASACYANLL